MKKFGVVSLFVISCVLSDQVQATDACVQLFGHSLYDEVSATNTSLNYLAVKDAFCKSDVTKTDSKQEADTGASYGIISGYGNFSNEDKKTIQDAICKDNESFSIIKEHQEIFTRTLNRDALKAATDCMALEATGLEFTVTDETDDSFTAGLSFSPQKGDPSKFRVINYPNIMSQNIACSGLLAKAKTNTKITNSVSSMVCRRILQAKNESSGEPQYLDNGGTVTISTTAGPLTASLPRKPNPNYKPVPPKPIDITGWWNSRGNPNPYRAQIASADNSNYTFSNEFRSIVGGKRNDEYNVELAGAWGHLFGRITRKGQLLLWSNGTWWSRSEFNGIAGEAPKNLAGSWQYAGMETRVSGTDQAPAFYNERGNGSQGRLLDQTTVQGFNMPAKVVDGGSTILWSNGTYWSR